MTESFRLHRQKPVRRVVATQSAYALYRKELREDFSRACGYCDDDDARADKSTFHIDHFAPKKRFPQLECSYENLIYACRFCNISKSDHWIGDDPSTPNNGTEGFVDPCSVEYDEHLERIDGGQIVAKSALGKFMIRRLNLHLLRHELLWRARKGRRLRDEIHALLNAYREKGMKPPEYTTLLERFEELAVSIDDYELHAAS